MKYSEISDKIIGAAMKVHRGLGLGFQEYIYQRALEIELVNSGLKFTREYELPIFYSGEKIGIRVVDFFVEDKIMVELKATAELESVHMAQAFNYIEASGVEVGLLINFGGKSLQFKRLHNKKLISSSNNPL
jgi:GxxExxY protein